MAARSHRLASLCAAALCLACAGGGAVPTGSFSGPVTERLEMEPPDGWLETVDAQTRAGSRLAWVPGDQPAKEARDRLVREILPGRQATAPRDFASQRLRELGTGCITSSSDGPRPATEEGNDTAYAEVTCMRGDGWTLSALVKVIRGHEALYVAQREFRRAPSHSELRAARRYLTDQVYLCPMARGLGRCAKGAP